MLDENSLATGVAALLDARGERDLGALVRRSFVEVFGRGERWEMGAREVAAHRISLVVSAPDHVFLSSSPARFTALRDAFATAVRTPETEMENLTLVLALPPSQTGFHRGYRDAPQRMPEAPDASAVLSGARALCVAQNDDQAARALERATLEDGFVTAGGRSVRKFVLRLDAPDFVRAERDTALGDRLMRAMRSAAVTPMETTTAVQLAVRLVEMDLEPGAEASFVRALERRNAVVVPVMRDEHRAVFGVVYQGKLATVELQKSLTRMRKMPDPLILAAGETDVGRIVVYERAIQSAEIAETASERVLEQLFRV